ncbi:MAG TPA: cadherin domain-containing protein [Thermoanaerobaculia bacterium]
MKSFRSAIYLCLLACLLPFSSALASASALSPLTNVTLSGNVLFSSLDGSAQDTDGVANGVFTVNGDLILDGTINCNDDPPLAGNASACPIRISVSGDLTMRAGSGIFAENRRGGGTGGNIQLTVGGNLILLGPSGTLPGAIVSSSRLTDGAEPAGSITFSVHGNTVLEAGSTVTASTPNGAAGTIGITADGTVTAAGLVASGPSRQVLATKLTGKVLDGGKSNQTGGAIVIRSHSPAGPGIRVESGGIVVSQGETAGSQLVLLEACGIEVRGLVASMLKTDGPSQVVLRSGKGLLIDGRDLGGSGSRMGRVRADGVDGGSAGYMVDLFAEGDIQVLGPDPASSLSAVSSSPGTQAQRTGGMITAISLTGSLSAAGNAFEAGRPNSGNQGGILDLKAEGNVTLDGASLRAMGDFLRSAPARKGGSIAVRSFQGAISWTFGVGDVRPVGSGAPSSSQGSITLTACSTIDVTGAQFPTVGSALLPFPVENSGVCSPAAPTLPSGEPPLPVCNRPPVANSQTVTTDEDTPVTITLTGSDPDGNPLTFTIATPPAHGSLGPLTSPTATSVQVVYTPAPDYNGPDSFTFQVDDGNGGTSTATVTLNVTPVNDAPKVDAATFTLNENSPNGTVVGTVTFTDPDLGQGHTFAITAGNTGGAFAIDATTGQITVANGAALDFETTPSFSLTVQVTDDGTPVLSGTGTITINLNNQNEAPAVNPATFSVLENSANGTAVGTVTFTDPDAGQTHTFAILAGNTGGAFAINPTTGAITVANGAVLDFETTPAFTLTVQVTDSGAPPLSGTATVVINLIDVNEAPVVSPGAFAVDENSPIGTAVGVVSFTDPDAGQAHTFAITAGNTGGAFAINPTTGAITVAGAIDFETLPAYSLTVQVTDNGTPPLSGTATVTIAVNNLPEPPVANPDSFDAVGNTLLQVGASNTATGPHVFVTGNLLANDVDQDVPSTLTTSLSSASPGAQVTVNSDGTFTYLPPAGATGPTDTFTYNLTDGTFTVTGTVTVTLHNRVWFVKDDAAAGGLGRSADPFNTLAAAEAASQSGDIIFVFRGDTGTTPLSGGITLKDGQKLWGEGIGLTVPGFGTLVPAGSKPRIANTGGDAVSVPATVGNRQNVEIRGLDLQANGNAVKVNSIGANVVGVTISDNDITAAGLNGVNLSEGGTGAFTATLGNNAIAATGNGFDARTTSGAGTLTIDFSNNAVTSNTTGILIDGSAGGTTWITNFANNAVSQNNAGTGISITGARFDATPGGAYQTVSGGTTIIGTSGNGVGGSGLVLGSVSGDLAFTNLQIFADGGSALSLTGTGAVNTGAGTGTRVTVGAGVGIFEAIGGPAVNASNATIDLQLASLKSTNSATTGVALNGVTGTFSAGSGSSISNITSASGTAFQVGGSNATISYAGTINTTMGNGVSLTSNTGSTIGFTGTLTLSTGSSPAFVATGGGTVTATDTANTLNTSTGTALNVANTTIGSSGLKFRSISAGTAASGPANGIILNNTGLSGILTVSGSGGASTGGTIQKTGAEGILITGPANANFSWISIQNPGMHGISSTTANNLTIANTTITDSAGNNTTDDGIHTSNTTGTLTMTSCTISGARHQGITVDNLNTNMAGLSMTGTIVTDTPGGDGMLVQMRGTSVLTTGTISNNTFSNNSATGLQVNNADTGNISSLTVQNNTVTSNNAGMDFDLSQAASMTIVVQGNTITGSHSQALNLVASTSATGGSMTATLRNNNIGTAGVNDSGSAIGNGIRVANGGVNVSLTIDGNIIREVPNGRGIDIEAQAYTSNLSLKAKIVNNQIVRPSGTNQNIGCGANVPCPSASIFVLSDSNGLGGFDHVCTVIAGNSAYDPTSWPAGGEAAFYFARRTSASNTLSLEGTQANVTSQILSTNTVTSFTSADVVDEDSSGPVTIVPVGTCGGFPS